MYDKIIEDLFKLSQQDKILFQQELLKLINLIDKQHITKEQLYEEEISILQNKVNLYSYDNNIEKQAIINSFINKLETILDLMKKDIEAINLIKAVITEHKKEVIEDGFV